MDPFCPITPSSEAPKWLLIFSKDFPSIFCYFSFLGQQCFLYIFSYISHFYVLKSWTRNNSMILCMTLSECHVFHYLLPFNIILVLCPLLYQELLGPFAEILDPYLIIQWCVGYERIARPYSIKSLQLTLTGNVRLIAWPADIPLLSLNIAWHLNCVYGYDHFEVRLLSCTYP